MAEEKNFNGGRYVLKLLRKNILFIIICTVIVTALAALYGGLKVKPSYTAKKEVIFLSSIEDSSGNITSVRNNLTYAEIYIPTLAKNATAAKYINSANDIYHNNGGKGTLSAKKVEIEYDAESLIFSVAYNDASEKLATEKLEAFIQNLKDNVREISSIAENHAGLTGAVSAEVKEVQNRADISVENRLWLVIVAGCLIGAVLSCAAVIVINLLKGGIKTVEELEYLTETPVLSQICMETSETKKGGKVY